MTAETTLLSLYFVWSLDILYMLHTFNCHFFTHPLLIAVCQQCLLSDAHDRFTRIKADAPEMQQTNPQMTNTVSVLTVPSVFLQTKNNNTH